LLYAFASAPGGLLSRDMITRTLWDSDYAPDRHDNSLKTNIRRLRTLIAGTGAAIRIECAGYRLVLPRHSVFVAPCAS
jgi:DNA-binding response OmpR family regulator